MSHSATRPADTYSPLYFLASLGAGGLSVTFFMMLMFWVPHPNQPVPIFEDILSAFLTGPAPLKLAIVIAWLGIAFMAFLNVSSLIWNLKSFAAWKKTPAYEAFKASNAESAQLAMPLALAMTVNAMFIVGMVFVPGLWGVVEYLFPIAVIAFVLIGVLAFRMTGAFLGRILSTAGAFQREGHNSFAQMMPAFALSMVGVGLAAPAAMSTTAATVGVSLMASTLFAMATIVYMLFAAITGMNAMLKHGTAREAAPTLMVIVPILTVLGILTLRQTHGFDVIGGGHTAPAQTLAFLTKLLSVQLIFVGLGLVVLRAQGYFQDYVFGSKTSPGSYALVCPGVALSVMTHFWVNKGLVGVNLIDKFSLMYWVLSAFAIALQVGMITLVLRLNRQHFKGPHGDAALVPGE